MDSAFQARLRAARTIRQATWRERGLRILLWLATGAVITGLICASPNFEMNAFAFLPLLGGIVCAVQSGREYRVTEFTIEGREEIRAAKQKDRVALFVAAKAFAKSWFGRLLLAALVVLSCYLYISGGRVLVTDEKLLLGALVIVAAGWAWQTTLVLVAIAAFWWVCELDWHISTPAAVIVGAIIIAFAIKSDR